MLQSMLNRLVPGVILAAVSCFSVQASPLPQPTKQELAALQKLYEALPHDGQAYPCDSAFEPAYRAMMRLQGKTPENNKRLFQLFERMKAVQFKFRDTRKEATPIRYGVEHAPDSYQLMTIAPMPGGDPARVYTLSFSSTYVEPTQDPTAFIWESVSLYALDSNQTLQKLIAASPSSDGEGGLVMRNLPVGALPPTDGPNNPDRARTAALAMYQVEVANEGYCYNARLDSVAGNPGIHIDAPMTKGSTTVNLDKNIVICLNRSNPPGHDQDACDYGPTSGGTPNEKLHLLLPFKGYIRTPYPIVSLQRPDGTYYPAQMNAQLELVPAYMNMALVSKNGGACDVPYNSDPKEPWKGFFVNGNNLSWDFSEVVEDYIDFGYKCVDMTNNVKQDWFFRATLALDQGQGGAVVPVNQAYAIASPAAMPVGVKKSNQFLVQAISFQWGCLIEGTLVTMADGTTRPVEQLKAGDMVMTKGGRALRITGISPGTDNEFMKITDEAGNTVVMTPAHPVLAKRGMVMAKDLKAGDVVYSRERGETRLREVTPDNRAKPAKVYSVGLELPGGGPLTNLDDKVHYAGSILVGDYQVQGELMKSANAQSQ